MLLAYIDESGISYEISNGFWKDGPYAIWSSILIPENKYFHIERLYYELVVKLLGVKDWRKKELHATDIWNQRGNFSRIPASKIQEYFEELFQLLSKLNLKVVAGVQQKDSRLRSPGRKRSELKKSIYAFLHILEHKLSNLEQTGVLIADEIGGGPRDQQLSDIQELLYRRTKWRYNPGARSSESFKSKFVFETRACFLLDQIHHSKSSSSFFLQLADHVSFVLQRVLTHLYLEKFPGPGRPVADQSKVPVSTSTFNFFIGQSDFTIGFFNENNKDVTFITPTRLSSPEYFGGPNNFINSNILLEFTPFK